MTQTDQVAEDEGRLDPDIQRFVTAMSESYRLHPPLDTVSPADARAIADKVRAPWARGGPQMARTQEHVAPTEAGGVRLRVYDPGGPDPKPALVYLHGGGWTLFSLDTHDRVMREYAARSGCVVVGVDYALSPEEKFPRALNQVVGVLRWLGSGGAIAGVDSGRIAVGGDSAGANLAVAAAIALRDAGEVGLVSAILVNYGAFDDECAPEALARWGGPGAMLEGGEMAAFWSSYLRDGDRDDPLARPILADMRDLPPTHFTIAECDILAEQNDRMARRLAAAGVPVRERTYCGATHSFLEAISISALARQALRDGADWLKAALARPQGAEWPEFESE